MTTGANDDIQPSWSPDGKTLLFVRSHQVTGKMEPGDVFGQYDGGDVWRLELGSGKENKLIENAVSPAYSPDGKRIAVDASWAGPRRIWIVDGEGHNPQQVTTDASEAVAHVSPRWSPDGTKIVFQNIERTTLCRGWASRPPRRPASAHRACWCRCRRRQHRVQ